MSLHLPGHLTDQYQIRTPVYAGPLDLLLELIEKAELDITTLALAQVTDQYLEHLEGLQERDPAEVSAFLVMAARLLQIKSSALLPKPSPIIPPVDEDPGEALARQLIQYRRFKQIANWLLEREENGLRTYLRVAPYPIKVEPKLDLSHITLDDLVAAAQRMLSSSANGMTNLGKVVTISKVTIRGKIKNILQALRQTGTSTFRAMLSSHNRLEIVVTFLAMLELIKRNIIDARQEVTFGDISLAPLNLFEEFHDTESEFGE